MADTDREFARAAFERHRNSAHVSLEEHVSAAQEELAQSLSGKQAVYLDVNYWILLRKVTMGMPTAQSAVVLLRRLRSVVETGRAFCPISESTFVELFKQSDANTRAATAALIDELSGGVAIQPLFTRLELEIAHLIGTFAHPREYVLPLLRVWTKVGYVLGMQHLNGMADDPERELVLQKTTFDYRWACTLAEIVRVIGDAKPDLQDRFDSLATRLNDGNKQHAAELKSFQQSYASEFAGSCDVLAPLAAELVTRVTERALGQPIERSGAEWDLLVSQWKNWLIGHMKSDDLRNTLRSSHIDVALHAALRWNKAHQFEGNDFYDFRHAAVGLAYCKLFLTERSLKSLATAKHVALDKAYGCTVVATVDEALTALESW